MHHASSATIHRAAAWRSRRCRARDKKGSGCPHDLSIATASLALGQLFAVAI